MATVKVDFPGHHLHGRTLEAEEDFLVVKPGASVQGGKWRKKRAADLAEQRGDLVFHCWVVRDENGAPCALPYSNAREVTS